MYAAACQFSTGRVAEIGTAWASSCQAANASRTLCVGAAGAERERLTHKMNMPEKIMKSAIILLFMAPPYRAAVV